jgi:hypothetical protein
MLGGYVMGYLLATYMLLLLRLTGVIGWPWLWTLMPLGILLAVVAVKIVGLAIAEYLSRRRTTHRRRRQFRPVNFRRGDPLAG